MTLIPETFGYRTFVLSAMCADNTADDNHRYHAVLTRRLGEELSLGRVFAVLQCEGCYLGAVERSIAVVAPYEWTGTALELGRHYEQDSILICDACGRGELIFMDGRTSRYLGFYQPISANGAYDHTHVLGTDHRFTFF